MQTQVARPKAHGGRGSVSGLLVSGLIASLPLATSPLASQALDRTRMPAAKATPVTKIPTWTRTKLANGAELVVSVKKELPLVSFNIGFVGGLTSYEPNGKAGLGGFVAQMLSEGTTTKSADELSNAQQLLGINIAANITNETGVLGFTALKDRLDGAMEIGRAHV